MLSSRTVTVEEERKFVPLIASVWVPAPAITGKGEEWDGDR